MLLSLNSYDVLSVTDVTADLAIVYVLLCMLLNSLPNDKILDLSKLEAFNFADNKIFIT